MGFSVSSHLQLLEALVHVHDVLGAGDGVVPVVQIVLQYL